MSDIVRLKHIKRESHHGGFSLLHPGKLYVFRHYEPRIWSIRTQISLHDAAFSKHIQRFSWFKFKWLSARQSVPLSKKAAKPENVKEVTN